MISRGEKERKKYGAERRLEGNFLPGKREEIKLVLVLPARLHSIPYDNYGLVASDPPANNKSDGDSLQFSKGKCLHPCQIAQGRQ